MELFPETTVESIFDIRAAREIAVRLSNDHEFADRVGTEANARIRSYKGLKQREGMDALLNELAAKKRD